MFCQGESTQGLEAKLFRDQVDNATIIKSASLAHAMLANLAHSRKDMHHSDVRCSLTNTVPTSPPSPSCHVYMQCQLDDGNVYGLLSPFSHQTIFVHSPFTSLTTAILSIKPAKNSSLARFLNGNCFLVCCFPLLQARRTKCTTATSSVLSPLRKTSPPSALEVLLQVCRDVLNSHLSAGQA